VLAGQASIRRRIKARTERGDATDTGLKLKTRHVGFSEFKEESTILGRGRIAGARLRLVARKSKLGAVFFAGFVAAFQRFFEILDAFTDTFPHLGQLFASE